MYDIPGIYLTTGTGHLAYSPKRQSAKAQLDLSKLLANLILSPKLFRCLGSPTER